jgi:hypothetical protein
VADQPSLFPKPARRTGRARRGADVTVRALRNMGRLERVDESLVVAQRVAADNLDEADRLGAAGEVSPFVVGHAVRTFLAATGALYARVGMVAPDDDEFWDALAAPVGDPPPG